MSSLRKVDEETLYECGHFFLMGCGQLLVIRPVWAGSRRKRLLSEETPGCVGGLGAEKSRGVAGPQMLGEREEQGRTPVLKVPGAQHRQQCGDDHQPAT